MDQKWIASEWKPPRGKKEAETVRNTEKAGTIPLPCKIRFDSNRFVAVFFQTALLGLLTMYFSTFCVVLVVLVPGFVRDWY
jgi:hypothetical protein